MKRHFIPAVGAALVTAAITTGLHFYGAHDMGGLVLAMLGFAGLLTGDRYGQVNQVIFTCVNFVFYFAIFEAIVSLIQRYSGPRG